MEKNNQKKEWYKKWWVWVIAVFACIFLCNKIGNFISNAGTKDIPNIFGVNHTEAVSVLENQGFKVTEIETNAESILSNSIYDRSVNKGEVFKINDEVDPNPYNFTTKDKNITIYYAEADYTYIESDETESSAEEVLDHKEESQSTTTDNATTSSSATTEWKQFLKDYESWADSYIRIVKKYSANPTDMSVLSDYTEMMAELTDWQTRSDEITKELESASPAEVAEYSAELMRIAAKIAEAAY